MEEKTEANENFIKVLNKEKVLEFKLNQKSGFEESEIIIKNNSKENIISKVYINNYKQFKCCPSILTLQKNATCKIKVIMDNKDYTIWEIIMTAPEDSEYNGGKYTVIAEFPLDYPMENPKFTFETEIYHCNVDKKNNLKVNWLMKGMKMEYILPRLLTLFYLQDPNVDENYENYEKCQLYKNNYDKFKENIKKSIKEQ